LFSRLRIPAAILSLGLALPILAVGLIFETWRGRLALVPLLAAVALPPALLSLACRTDRRARDFAASSVLGAIALVSLAAVFLAAPPGHAEQGAPAQQVFLTDHRFHRCSPFNLIPELDQMKMGVVLGPALGLLQDREEARRLTDIVLPLEREAEARPDFRQMGSVAGWTLAENWGGEFDAGHLYQYVPAHPAGERLPVLIVLHGFGGNHKAYPLAFEEFGARNRFIVLCPSYGFGFYRDGWLEAMDRVRAYALRDLGADPARLFLLGYSNGGIGVFKAAAARPGDYAGMVLLSAVLRLELFTPDVRAAWGERPILCLSGGRDGRISPEYTSDGVDKLRALGLHVTAHSYPEEDHFLIFSQRRDLADRIRAWMEAGK
jgi:predicted esterase